ncbi:MAG: class I SAM-dependent methyltransferase [Anaerolineaceae bacterium]|nr:class I SAM-dependent methyltransferase [Anaerolineaceae bacterium]
MLKSWLSEPLARGLELDDPVLTDVRRTILQKKRFLRAIYTEWYQLQKRSIPDGPGIIFELGSGSGFAQDSIPKLISSEVFWLSSVSLVVDGCALPFPDQSAKAIIMTDVLHHLPNPRGFFSEVTRCLGPGGVLTMVEPWVTSWSRFVYKHYHHENFEPDSLAWEFETSGPLSGSNQALPWMIFERDKPIFTKEFPLLSVESIYPMMPFCFLLSGGLSVRGIIPGFLYHWCRSVEGLLDRWNADLGLFAFIVLRRITLPS